MTLIPDFSENKENCVRLYFKCGDRTPQQVISALENTYACYSTMKVTVKDSEKYICLEITDLE